MHLEFILDWSHWRAGIRILTDYRSIVVVEVLWYILIRFSTEPNVFWYICHMCVHLTLQTSGLFRVTIIGNRNQTHKVLSPQQWKNTWITHGHCFLELILKSPPVINSNPLQVCKTGSFCKGIFLVPGLCWSYVAWGPHLLYGAGGTHNSQLSWDNGTELLQANEEEDEEEEAGIENSRNFSWTWKNIQKSLNSSRVRVEKELFG